MLLKEIQQSQLNFWYTLSVIVIMMVAERVDLFVYLFKVTPSQQVAIAIVILAAVLWITEWVPLYVTTFVILLLELVWLLPALEFAGIEVSDSDFLSPFFSNIILLFLGGFVISALLNKYQLDTMFAGRILKRTGGRPGLVLAAIMTICAFLSMWISNTATTAMMLAMVYPIIDKIPTGNRFGKGLALAIPFACNLGGLGTPIGTPPNAIAVAYLAREGIAISFAEWMLYTFPFLLVLLVFVWFLLLKLYPPGDLNISVEDLSDDHAKGGLSRRQVIALAIFLLTALGWCTGNLHHFKTGTVALFPIIITFGFGLLSKEDFRHLPWDVLYMVAGGMVLGVGIQVSGLGEHLVGLVPDEAGYLVVVLIAAVLAVVMTTFMSNTATANLIIPIAMALSFSSGDLMVLIVTMACLCSTAMALPISTPPNAIAFSSGILSSRDMILPGLLITFVSFLVIVGLGGFYWRLLGMLL